MERWGSLPVIKISFWKDGCIRELERNSVLEVCYLFCGNNLGLYPRVGKFGMKLGKWDHLVLDGKSIEQNKDEFLIQAVKYSLWLRCERGFSFVVQCFSNVIVLTKY